MAMIWKNMFTFQFTCRSLSEALQERLGISDTSSNGGLGLNNEHANETMARHVRYAFGTFPCYALHNNNVLKKKNTELFKVNFDLEKLRLVFKKLVYYSCFYS